MSVVWSFKARELVRGKKSPAGALSDSAFFMKGNNSRAVILIHGLTGTPVEMKPIAQFLNRKGYTVACPCLANHGEPINVLKWSKWQEFYESVRKVMIDGRRILLTASRTRRYAAASINITPMQSLKTWKMSANTATRIGR
ncbi:MAG: hypothetical protein NTW09_01250 [Candidatus Omnitrophica bacterium]|nr:hypothetical protein [Candidatus Omnitrophota bacterium]